MKGGASLDRRGFDALVTKSEKNVGGIRLTVGVHRGTQNKSTDVALYAGANNYGVKKNGIQRIPARNFMGYSANRIIEFMNSPKYDRLLTKFALGQASREEVIKIIGETTVSITRKTIRDSSLYAPNAAVTKARKGSTKPLIASAVMLQTVSWRKG